MKSLVQCDGNLTNYSVNLFGAGCNLFWPNSRVNIFALNEFKVGVISSLNCQTRLLASRVQSELTLVMPFND